jgi:hypothetical protein
MWILYNIVYDKSHYKPTVTVLTMAISIVVITDMTNGWDEDIENFVTEQRVSLNVALSLIQFKEKLLEVGLSH